jgi:chromosome segregation ATPase
MNDDDIDVDVAANRKMVDSLNHHIRQLEAKNMSLREANQSLGDGINDARERISQLKIENKTLDAALKDARKSQCFSEEKVEDLEEIIREHWDALKEAKKAQSEAEERAKNLEARLDRCLDASEDECNKLARERDGEFRKLEAEREVTKRLEAIIMEAIQS